MSELSSNRQSAVPEWVIQMLPESTVKKLRLMRARMFVNVPFAPKYSKEALEAIQECIAKNHKKWEAVETYSKLKKKLDRAKQYLVLPYGKLSALSESVVAYKMSKEMQPVKLGLRQRLPICHRLISILNHS